MAFLEAAIPAERQHVQLEVDDEPAVPEEPAAAVPFVTWKSVFFVFIVDINVKLLSWGCPDRDGISKPKKCFGSAPRVVKHI